MQSFRIKFTVNGRVTEQIVSANSQYDAEKILKAQYPHSQIMIITASRA
ncbi:MAG: hypothetical protein IKD89_02840 [Clostridia bacterium]|nr:hypothetical protein [Clostridia bacterium]